MCVVMKPHRENTPPPPSYRCLSKHISPKSHPQGLPEKTDKKNRYNPSSIQ